MIKYIFFYIYSCQYFLHQPGYIWFQGYHQSSTVQWKQQDDNQNQNFLKHVKQLWTMGVTWKYHDN